MAGGVESPAAVGLYLLAQVEQRLGLEIGADPDDGVEEVRLVEDLADRLGLVERGGRLDLDSVAPRSASSRPAGAPRGRRRWTRGPGSRSAPGYSSSSSSAYCSVRSWTTSTATSWIASGSGGSGLATRDPDRFAAVAIHQALAGDLGEALEGAVAALGRGEGDDVADLAVVDRVLEPVGENRVAVGDVEGDVELEPLADLLLGVGDAVVGVDRETPQVDLDPRFDPVSAGLHLRPNLPEDCFGDPDRLRDLGHIVDAEDVGALGGGEDRGGDRAAGRSPTSEPSILPMKLLREAPITSGRPNSRSSPSRRSSSRLCPRALPKPIPGSSQTSPRPPRRRRRVEPLGQKALTSSTTSS